MADDDNMLPAGRPLEALARDECGGIDPYECEEAIKRLNDYLDQELSDGERLIVLRHLEICRPCLRRFTFEQSLIVTLRQKTSTVCTPQTLRDKLHSLIHQNKI